MTVTESRFDRREVDTLLASRRAEQAPRGAHGHLLSDAMDPKNQFAWKASGPVKDFAQAALDIYVGQFKKAHPKTDMGSLNFTVDQV